MLLTDGLEEFVETAVWAVLPLGFALLAYFDRRARQASLIAVGTMASVLFRVGSALFDRIRHAAPLGSKGTASANQAFDDHRAATLGRLRDEQCEFRAFVQRLRQARDKAEFDAFVSQRESAKS